jgi:hypothetical protein
MEDKQIQQVCPNSVKRGLLAGELENVEATAQELLMRGCPTQILKDEVKKEIVSRVNRKMKGE